jgi:hypothetical protein
LSLSFFLVAKLPLVPLVPKLPLGNPVPRSSASPPGEAGASLKGVPKLELGNEGGNERKGSLGTSDEAAIGYV